MKTPPAERQRRPKAPDITRQPIEDVEGPFNAREVLRPQLEQLVRRVTHEGAFDVVSGDMPGAVRTLLLFFPETRPELQRFGELMASQPGRIVSPMMLDGLVQAYPEQKDKQRKLYRSIDLASPVTDNVRFFDRLYIASILFPEHLSEYKSKAHSVAEQHLNYLRQEAPKGTLKILWRAVELVLLCPEYREKVQPLFRRVLDNLGRFSGTGGVEYLNTVYALEIIYGRDRAELNDQGEIEFTAKKMESKVPLPERPTI